jgi:hypothetical protein
VLHLPPHLSAALPMCLILFSMLVMFGRRGLTWVAGHGWGESFEWRKIRVGRACDIEQARGAASGCGPRAGRPSASLRPNVTDSFGPQ